MADKGLKRCNFCGKPENQVRNMFTAGNCNICDDCVVYCYEMLAGNGLIAPNQRSSRSAEKRSSGAVKLMKPAEIKKVLDEYVIGQDGAKTALAPCGPHSGFVTSQAIAKWLSARRGSIPERSIDASSGNSYAPGARSFPSAFRK